MVGTSQVGRRTIEVADTPRVESRMLVVEGTSQVGSRTARKTETSQIVSRPTGVTGTSNVEHRTTGMEKNVTSRK